MGWSGVYNRKEKGDGLVRSIAHCVEPKLIYNTYMHPIIEDIVFSDPIFRNDETLFEFTPLILLLYVSFPSCNKSYH